ncbi:MAG: response regulator [Alphaproteobacteria bacterium]
MARDAIVYVVDDDIDFLESLKSILEAADFRVKIFPSARQLMDTVEVAPNSCVVADIRMPGIDGLELQRQLKERRLNIPIIFISGYGDVALAVRAMRQGAVDFIEKPVNEAMLIESVNRAIQASRNSWERVNAEERARALVSTLSAREKEVFHLLAQGLQNADISNRLNISTRTVEVHRANLYRKLEVKNLAALVRLALLAGLVSPTSLFESPAGTPPTSAQ